MSTITDTNNSTLTEELVATTTPSQQNQAVTITTEEEEPNTTTTATTTTPATATVSKPRKEVRIDHLDEDPMLSYEISAEMMASSIFRQMYFVMAFVSPENVSNCKTRAFKLRGVYPTEEEANKASAHFRDMDGGIFNNFVGCVGKWSEFDPDPKKVVNQVHADERMNNLMKGYKDNYEKSKKVHEDRVNEVKRRSSQAPKMTQILDRMHGKLDKIKEQKEKVANTEKLFPSVDDADTSNITTDTSNIDAATEQTSASTASTRRRLKDRMRKATEESIAREEKELADRHVKLTHMREEMARRSAKTQVFSQDVEDIRAAFEQKRSEIAAQ